ncbi:MAG: S9 family peptidase [Planctomycetota bacterium]
MKPTLRLTLPLLTAFFSFGPSEAREDVMTMEHVARLKGVSSAVISPDGLRVAYTVSVPRIPFEDENGSPWTELHITDMEGNSHPFITGDVNVSGVQWTPDGAAISFLAKRGEDKFARLYQIPLAGGEARRVLSHVTSIDSYSWSPDGKQVAFLATDQPDDRIKQLKEKGFDAEVLEEVLDFVRVWIATPGSDEKPRQLELEGSASSLQWSPAGDRLVLALAPTPLVDDSYMFRKVHVVNVADGSIVARFDNPGKLGQVEFSPEGRSPAMISAADPNDPEQGRLMVATSSGGSLTDILPGVEGHVTSIAWRTPNRIVFLLDQGTTTSLEQVTLDGEDREAIIPAGRVVLSGLSLSKDGMSGAALSDSRHHPRELYGLAAGAPSPRRLTNSNPWLSELRLARQEVVRFPARDGLEIEGVLIRPLDEQEGTRYPLILSVHGGPEAHIANGWLTRYSSPGQVAAAGGYAVFYPNYRGSTGRGVAFSKLGQADYAGAEFNDLIDSIDYFIDAGLADRDRVGITGGSYGGYAAAWCATYHTKRFAAAVMFVGISDLISKAGSTDIPEEMFMVHARKRPWDDWKFFLERSPIFYVEQARTPLLIMGGKDDPRVHPSQSLELYRQLKVLGNTPVRLVKYPGEGHGNRKAAARYDYSLRMMRWFDHYLKGEGGAPPAPELDYPLEKKDAKETEAKQAEADATK